MLQLTELSRISVPPRQRTERPRGFIQQLKESIVSKGLMHPIVLSQRSGTDQLTLIAGESRYMAISELHTDGIAFLFQNVRVTHNQIPYVLLSDLTPDMIAEAELEENIVRAQLLWQDEAAARVLIHQLRLAQNPKQTLTATAKERVNARDGSQNEVQAEHKNIQKALLVSKHLDNPRVKAAKTLNEAVKVVLDEQENAFRAQLIAAGGLTTAHQLFLGDLCVELPKLPDRAFDCIICDPPYGINADQFRTIQKEAGEKKRHEGHHYADSIAYSDAICNTIFREGFRVLKNQGLLFMFCDIDRFHFLREAAAKMAFSPYRTPIVWHKIGAQSGFAPWGNGGFVRSYELLLMCSKGQKTLTRPGGPDVVSFNRVHHSEKTHAAEKPVELYTWLLDRACIPGDTVLDPCCGSGTIFEAAEASKVIATGIELDRTYHDQAAARLMGALETTEAAE